MNSRIIGDFLEINSDIVQEEFKSRLPKFIKRIKYKRHRKRLLDNVSKLRDSNMILDVDNIIELLSYVYNNYPETSYRSIYRCKVDPILEEYEGIIKFDNQISIITIDKDQYPKFTINSKVIVSKGVTEGIDIQVDKLYSDNDKKNDILSKVNSVLLDNICDYIEDIIKPYYEENNDVYMEKSVIEIR